MVHADNDRTRCQEQQRLEKRMSHQVENTRCISGNTQCHHHITQLRQCRVGNHTFNIVLNDTNQPGKESRRRANHQNKTERCLG